MTNLSLILQRSLPVWSLLSALASLLVIAGCAMLSEALFRLPLRKKAFIAVAAALSAVFGALDPILSRSASDFAQVLISGVGLAIPFVAMALIFRGRGLWKAMLAAAGYSFVEAASLLAVLFFFGFDYTDRNDALELLVSLPLDMLFFGAALALLLRGLRRRTDAVGLTRTGVALYILMVLSTSVFVATLLVTGPVVSESSSLGFALILFNIPLIAVTVAFAVIRFSRMKTESENYRRQLRMQIAQFERMESVMEDVRIFRHDFPKKMRPLIACLDADRPDEARKMAEQFTDFAVNVGDRYHTGNYRLDTVLSFERQIAERGGVTLDVPFDTVFPAEGIEPDDIYTIFPNALDNAIEACVKLPEEKRVISFRSRMDARTVFVTICNPYSGALRTKNGLPQTGKADKAAHGYGLRSIKKAAAKYGEDNVFILTDNGVFELRLCLNYSDGD